MAISKSKKNINTRKYKKQNSRISSLESKKNNLRKNNGRNTKKVNRKLTKLRGGASGNVKNLEKVFGAINPDPSINILNNFKIKTSEFYKNCEIQNCNKEYETDLKQMKEYIEKLDKYIIYLKKNKILFNNQYESYRDSIKKILLAKTKLLQNKQKKNLKPTLGSQTHHQPYTVEYPFVLPLELSEIKKTNPGFENTASTGSNQVLKIENPIIVKNIKHFWYRKWIDSIVPYQFKKNIIYNDPVFITFIDMLLDDINTKHGDTLIHCSTGVDRSGMIFVILKLCLLFKKSLTEMLKTPITESEIKANLKLKHLNTLKNIIDNIIYNMRAHKMNTVQTNLQYKFICKLFNIPFIETDFNKFNEFTNELNKKINTDEINFFKSCYDKNSKLSRYPNTIPYNDTIVNLNLENNDCNNLINASYLENLEDYDFITQPITNENENIDLDNTPVNNYLNNINVKRTESLYTIINKQKLFKGDVIVAEGPTEHSKNNFLKMLGLNKLNIKRIIMLTNLNEKKGTYANTIESKCFDYTNQDEKNITLTDISSIVLPLTANKIATVKEMEIYTQPYGNITEYELQSIGDGNFILTNGKSIQVVLAELPIPSQIVSNLSGKQPSNAEV